LRRKQDRLREVEVLPYWYILLVIRASLWFPGLSTYVDKQNVP